MEQRTKDIILYTCILLCILAIFFMIYRFQIRLLKLCNKMSPTSKLPFFNKSPKQTDDQRVLKLLDSPRVRNLLASRAISAMSRSSSPPTRSPDPQSRSPVHQSRSPVHQSRAPAHLSQSTALQSRSPAHLSRSPVSQYRSPAQLLLNVHALQPCPLQSRRALDPSRSPLPHSRSPAPESRPSVHMSGLVPLQVVLPIEKSPEELGEITPPPSYDSVMGYQSPPPYQESQNL